MTFLGCFIHQRSLLAGRIKRLRKFLERNLVVVVVVERMEAPLDIGFREGVINLHQ